MPGKPAARKFDLTVHVPVIIITGSPDTKIGYLPAARLNDVATPCLLPICKPPQGKIVSSSTTVFINRLGAARIGDFVLDNAGAKPPGPGGCSHPKAKGYSARGVDHYEKLIELEHEANEWDTVDEFKRKKYAKKRPKVASPTGIAASGKTRKTSAAKKRSPAKTYRKSGKGNPWGYDASGDARLEGGTIKAKGKKVGADLPKVKPEAKRPAKPKKMNLKFPINMKLGSRGGSGGMAPATNVIALGCFTVLIG